MAENENNEGKGSGGEAAPEKASRAPKSKGDEPEGGASEAKPETSARPEKPEKPGKGAGKAGGEGKSKTGKGAKPEKGAGKGAKGAKGSKPAKKADTGPAVAYKREAAPRLKRQYDDEVRQKLREEFSYTNPMQIPRLVKISVNMGLGAATQNPKMMDTAVEEMRAISGRTPVVTLAKKDIATFKLRRGHKIGVMVTLRREVMWEFLDRFLNVALPRVRDFRGLSPKAFDGRGNYSIGVKEQIIFPEIEYDSIESVKGLNVTIVTTAKTDAEGRALLRYLGVPFRQAVQAETAQGAQA